MNDMTVTPSYFTRGCTNIPSPAGNPLYHVGYGGAEIPGSVLNFGATSLLYLAQLLWLKEKNETSP